MYRKVHFAVYWRRNAAQNRPLGVAGLLTQILALSRGKANAHFIVKKSPFSLVLSSLITEDNVVIAW